MRMLAFALNKGYTPRDRERLVEKLRKVMDVRNMRIASSHIEIEVWNTDPDKVRSHIENVVGEVVFVDHVDNIEKRLETKDMDAAIKLYIQLFNEERFWEAHIVLESIWRRSRDPRIQALIKLAASHVKIQENKPEYARRLAMESLEMMDPVKLSCLDLKEVMGDIEVFVENLKPIKLKSRFCS